MLIATPLDENETRLLLNSCYHYPGPAAVRYPRGQGTGVIMDAGNQRLEIGKAKLLRESDQPQVLIVNFGTLLKNALPAAEHFNATVLDMRFVKPLDTDALQQHIAAAELVVTVEENAVMGGAGSAVVEYMMQAELIKPVLQLGLPDQYIDHGKHSELLQQCELSSEAITARIAAKLEAH